MFEKIKMAWAGFKGIREIPELIEEAKTEVKMDGEIKSGWQTSEFKGKVIVQLVSLAAVVAALMGHNISPELQQQIVLLGVGAIGGLEALYTVGRSAVKMFAEWRKAKEAQATTATAVAPATTATATVSTVPN